MNKLVNQAIKNTKTKIYKTFKEFTDLEIQFKDCHNSIGSYKKQSISEYEPEIFLNINIEKLFKEYHINDELTKIRVIEDTLIHEYSHIIFEIIENSDENLLEDIKNMIFDLDEDFVLTSFKKEMKDIDFEYIFSLEELIEECYEDYEYVREEIFVENLMFFIQNKFSDNIEEIALDNPDFNQQVFDFINTNFSKINNVVSDFMIEFKEEQDNTNWTTYKNI